MRKPVFVVSNQTIPVNMNRLVRKSAFCEMRKTKAHISCAVTVLMISTFVFATWIVQPLLFLHQKFQAWFVSDLVKNPEDRFSRDVAHKELESCFGV